VSQNCSTCSTHGMPCTISLLLSCFRASKLRCPKHSCHRQASLLRRATRHWLRHLHVEDVEAVGASVHLSKKATMAIPNAQDPMLDFHARAVLIRLSQADGVP
jgi:hypothetical protein